MPKEAIYYSLKYINACLKNENAMNYLKNLNLKLFVTKVLIPVLELTSDD